MATFSSSIVKPATRHTRYWRDWSSDVCSSDLKAVSKDVYQESDGGKWVRYDENGKMIKGWNTNEKGCLLYTSRCV